MVCCGDSFAPSDGVLVGSDPLAVCAQKKVLLIDLLISQRFGFVRSSISTFATFQVKLSQQMQENCYCERE